MHSGRRKGYGLLLSATLLAACGGSGDSAPAGAAPPVGETRAAATQNAVCTGAASAGWCWMHPRPTGNAIADIAFGDAGRAWAVDNGGALLRSADGGATWSGSYSPYMQVPRAVRFADASHGWVVGLNETLLYTRDGGSRWAPRSLGVPASYATVDLWVPGPATAVAAGAIGGGSLQTQDGGRSWQRAEDTPTHQAPGALWSVGQTTASKSSDGGKTYTESLRPTPQTSSSNHHLELASFPDDRHGWVWGREFADEVLRGKLWATRDGGTTWSSWEPRGLPENITELQFFDAAIGWARESRTYFRTTDGGATWSRIEYSSTGYPTPEGWLDANTLWLHDDNLEALRVTRDAGASWHTLKPVSAEAGLDLTPELQIAPDGAYWAKYGDRRYRSADQGKHWKRVLGPVAHDVDGPTTSLWFFDALRGFAQTSKGSLLSTSDGGASWKRRDSNPLDSFRGRARLQFATPKRGWMASRGAGIARTTDGGKTWKSPAQAGDLDPVTDFHFADTRNGWAVARDYPQATLYRTRDGGVRWREQAYFQYETNGLRFLDDRIGLVMGGGGMLLRTTDGGEHWSAQPTGVSAPLRRAWFVDRSDVWVVGDMGTVLHSRDGGLTWRPVAVPATETLNDVAFANAGRGWIVGNNGIVLATQDGGRSWSRQRSGTRLDLHSLAVIDARTAWIGGANGAILMTTTAGR